MLFKKILAYLWLLGLLAGMGWVGYQVYDYANEEITEIYVEDGEMKMRKITVNRFKNLWEEINGD